MGQLTVLAIEPGSLDGRDEELHFGAGISAGTGSLNPSGLNMCPRPSTFFQNIGPGSFISGAI